MAAMIEGMGRLTLVRHGQASFGAADYDNLSELGERQCRLLGSYWRGQERRFSSVLVGTLKRHAQSLAAIRAELGEMPEPLMWPGLNEFDFAAIIRAVHPGELRRPRDASEIKHYFRLLREGLRAWIAGETAPVGVPHHAAFVEGVTSALDQVRAHGEGEVLIVSSGGPISTAVAHVLGAPAQSAIELNLQLRNSALTEFVFNAEKLSLMSFNHLPHLEAAGLSDLATHA